MKPRQTKKTQPLSQRPPTVADEWCDFNTTVIPVDAPEEQRIALRRSFYCGACSMFGLLNWLSPDAEPTDEDIQHLDTLYEELRTFQQELATDIIRELARVGRHEQ